MSAKVRIPGVVAALAAMTYLVLVLAHPAWTQVRPLPLIGAAWIAFVAAVWLLRGLSGRWSVALILLGGLALQVAALSTPPQQSTDMYRYIWDGRVQAAGIDPYSYVPAAPQLKGFRDSFLWPANGPYCVGLSGASAAHAQLRGLPPGCTRINRPRVHTIYPPVAEAYFTGVGEVSPPGGGTFPIQAAGALCAIATSILLVVGLRRLGRDPRFAVFWAWCPVVGLQAGNNAHVDVLAAFLTAAALLTLARPGQDRQHSRRRAIGGGVLLGLAIATKITPILAGPAVLRRR